MDMDIDVDVDLDMEFWKEGAFKLQAKALKEQAKALEAEFKNKDIQVQIEKNVTREFSRQVAEIGQAVPGPAGAAGAAQRSAAEAARARSPADSRRVGRVDRAVYTRFPVGKASTLMLSNISGNIQVTPGTADRMEVEALKRAWGPNAEQAKARLADAIDRDLRDGQPRRNARRARRARWSGREAAASTSSSA